MNLASSQLLGQYVTAGDVQPQDCETFQLVCPHCGDRVVKETTHALDDVRHFFTHASRSNAEAVICEAAVSAYTPQHIRGTNRSAQILSINALRKGILKPALEIVRAELQKIEVAPAEMERAIDTLMAADRFTALAEQARKQVKESEQKLRALFADVASDQGSQRRPDQTDFSRKIQLSIGQDMFISLTREPPIFYGVMALAVLVYHRQTERRLKKAQHDIGLLAVFTLLKGMLQPNLILAPAYHMAESVQIPTGSLLPAGASPRLIMAFDLLEVMSTLLASIDYEPMLREKQTTGAPRLH